MKHGSKKKKKTLEMKTGTKQFSHKAPPLKAAGPCDRITFRADLPRNGSNNRRRRKESGGEQGEQVLAFSAQRLEVSR